MKKVEIKIVNESGHTTKLMTVQEAVTEIKEQVQEHGKWCYIDGSFVKVDKLSQSDIASAKDITLTNALAGG